MRGQSATAATCQHRHLNRPCRPQKRRFFLDDAVQMPSANTLNMQHEALEHNFPPADVAAYDPRLAEALREHDGTLAATAEVVGEHDVTLDADGRPVVATDTTTPLGAAEASDPNALDDAGGAVERDG